MAVLELWNLFLYIYSIAPIDGYGSRPEYFWMAISSGKRDPICEVPLGFKARYWHECILSIGFYDANHLFAVYYTEFSLLILGIFIPVCSSSYLWICGSLV